MEQQAKFQAIFNGEIYQFRTGSHLYIFDCGLFWDMEKYGMDEFQKYIEFVYNCYLEADDPISPRLFKRLYRGTVGIHQGERFNNLRSLG